MQEGSIHVLGACWLLSLPCASPVCFGAGADGRGGALGTGWLDWLRWQLIRTFCPGFRGSSGCRVGGLSLGTIWVCRAAVDTEGRGKRWASGLYGEPGPRAEGSEP